jgi:hypothetical protein
MIHDNYPKFFAISRAEADATAVAVEVKRPVVNKQESNYQTNLAKSKCNLFASFSFVTIFVE